MICPIVFCLDKNFTGYTKLAIDSVLHHNPKAKIVLVVDEKIDELKQFKQFVLDRNILKEMAIRKNDRVTALTYARIFLPKLLKQYSKCIYVDGDILVRRSLKELIKQDIPFIGAVKEANDKWLLHGIQKDIYYNAGFLVLNLEALRKAKFTEKCIKYIKNYKKGYLGTEGTWLHDQTTINALFSEKITRLDDKWNTQLSWDPPPKYEEIDFSTNANIHFLTVYNKESFVRYSIDNAETFESFNQPIDLVYIIKETGNTGLVKENIDAILKQTYKNFRLNLFVTERLSSLDKVFHKIDDKRVRLYDCSLIGEDLYKVYEYAKSKIESDKIIVLEENIILEKNAIKQLIIDSYQPNVKFVIGKCQEIGVPKGEVFNYPRPIEARVDEVFYSYEREGILLCKRKDFIDYNFAEDKMFIITSFKNWLFAKNIGFTVSIPVICWYRTDLLDRGRFMNNDIEVTFMIIHSFKRLGFDINFNEAQFLNPYSDKEFITKKEQIHLMKIRRKIEDEFVERFDMNYFNKLFQM